MSDLECLINPKSVAVIGASSDPVKIGFQILNNLKNSGFSGEIFPVNPKYDQILELKAYVDISDCPIAVDLAIIVIPGMNVSEIVRRCGDKGVSAIIVISSGFSESGEVGKQRQAELVDICKEKNITMLGPNCLGFINTEINLNASFANSSPLAGKISVLSQSGAIISSIIDWSKSDFCGLNKIFSLGNKALITECDLLEYLYKDEGTEVVALYLEQLTIDDKFSRLLLQYSKIKPTIVLYGGKTSFGAHAASSHTGSIVSPYIAVKTYLEQLGVMMADDLRELFDMCKLFSCYKNIKGNKIGIVTNAGGPGIAASDCAFVEKLELPEPNEKTKEILGQYLPQESSMKNPIDLLGDATDVTYAHALNVLNDDSGLDGFAVLLTPQSSTKIIETANVIAHSQSEKPIISAFVGGESTNEGLSIIKRSGKPAYSFPEDAIKAFNRLVKFSTPSVKFIIPETPIEKHFEPENKTELLKSYHLPVLEYIRVENESELTSAANEIGYPLVLKMADENAHKSDVGGVILNIENEDQLKAAFLKVGGPSIVGKMVFNEREIFIGVKNVPDIGSVVTFGTGGIFSELSADYSYRIGPLDEEMAMAMIFETKIGKILSGERNQKKYDVVKLANILVNISWFAYEHKNIIEMDMNPLLASGDEYYIVDVRIITK